MAWPSPSNTQTAGVRTRLAGRFLPLQGYPFLFCFSLFLPSSHPVLRFWVLPLHPQVPFSEETKERFLPKLIDPDWCDHLTKELKRIAQIDLDFNERQFNKQIAVMRGQIFNLVEALMKQYTPLDLVEMTPLTISHVDATSGFRRRLIVALARDVRRG